ncbi:MAG: hypothetical protein ACP5O6_06785 [Candidatus Baltobacteraceae bacterium]
MIVTRQRRKPFPVGRIILPLVAILAILGAFIWPPSRAAILSGPLSPLWNTLGSRFAVVAAPFHFAAQNQLIARRNREIVTLQAQLADAQRSLAAAQKSTAALKARVVQLDAQVAQTHAKAAAPGVAPTATPGAFGATSAAAGSDLAASATPDDRRVAADWAAMDPSNAAKVVQRLPVPYDAKIFSLMSASDVGAILDALPPAFAARITQENPTLKP